MEVTTCVYPLLECTAQLARVATGSFDVLGALSIGGGYMSIVKILGMLVLILPWVHLAPWVAKDAKSVRAPKGLWNSVMLGVGGVVFLVWLLLPIYLAGLLLYAVAIASVLLSYLTYRNGQVPEEQKISLTSLIQLKYRKRESVVTKLKLYGANNQIVLPPDEETAEEDAITAYNLVQSTLYDVIWHRASEADLSPSGQQTRVRFVIDGVAVDRPTIPLSDSETIIQYLKNVADMDAEERRRPQKGQITVDLDGSPIEMDLAVAGKTTGQRMRFRIVQQFVQTKLDELGIGEEMIERIRELNQSDHGLFIVSGRQGSGVTSTLYSLLREQDAFIKQLSTLEAKVDVDLENITQNGYGDETRLPDALAGALRRDPDVIMVDRCRDGKTARLICQAAKQKLVLLGMQASDSFTAMAKWVKVRGNQAAAVENLRGCLCQILLRKLCVQCRTAYKPDPQLLAKVNMPADQIDMFYRPSGKQSNEKGQSFPCHLCQGSGYLGRAAVFELLEVTDELQRLVAAGGSLSQIKAAARKNRMFYLQEQALRKVIEGETSVQEVIRVSQTKK